HKYINTRHAPARSSLPAARVLLHTNAATTARRRLHLACPPRRVVPAPASPPRPDDDVRLLLPLGGARVHPRGGRGYGVAHLVPTLFPWRIHDEENRLRWSIVSGKRDPATAALVSASGTRHAAPCSTFPARRQASKARAVVLEDGAGGGAALRQEGNTGRRAGARRPRPVRASVQERLPVQEDGRRPIFHTPPLSGIYASEGWFMKLLKESRRHVVADAGKAHLFYLPYSSQQLRLTLYEAGSHNLRPLAAYLRNFVRGLASKYPFWNRTRGADHFLVACHDWGPYTTTAHRDLRKNAIKALCNADSSEGIFTPGKDVSLPETTIRTPRRPLRYVGGLPVSRRSILAFFAGNVHGRVRPVLLRHWGNGQDDDMRVYSLLPSRVSRRMNYIQHMKNSRFCLCPMGYEVNSPRIVEALYYECVPVIIADNFVLPFSEVLDWSAFSVVIAEKDIPDLKKILKGISLRRYVAMHDSVKRLQRHFLWHARPIKFKIT
uniref:Exostosin GT47 domain-containing protein n=1 Tax=Zea mays TaxID=4577 RepID=A0A804NGB2_MAIZE